MELSFGIAVLFLLATFGHGLLSVFSHNYWYGQPLHRHVTDAIQFVHFWLALAGPILFWILVGFDLTPLFCNLQSASIGQYLGAGYVGLCWLSAIIIFPWITIVRLQRSPQALIAEKSQRIDIAGKLGYKPVGRGKYRKVAQLPGNQIYSLELVERELHLPQIPEEWDGLTILHMSDIHFFGSPDRDYFREVVDLCNEWKPDLIALTGDYVDSVYYHRWIIPILGRLQSQIATIAILGNHDLWYEPTRLRRRFDRLGFHVLHNSIETLDIRGHSMTVIGQLYPWIKPGPDLSECPEDGFRLCLSHTPDNIRWAQEHHIDLMLSGHVHGGQIRFPLFGSMVVPSIYGRRYDCGVFDESPTVLHVTKGVGGKHPVRYHCCPEAVLLTLRKNYANASSST